MMTKEEMLRFIVRVARKARVKMAVGGGIAVAAHGFRRETSDINSFFLYEDKRKVLRALHQLGKDFRIEELEASHWIAVPPGNDYDEKIDLLFPVGDPEDSAIEMAKPIKYHSVTAMMFPIDFLIACKFMENRDDTKDTLDIYTLHRRGAFDVKDVTHRLRQMGLKEDAVAFVEFMKKLEDLSSLKANSRSRKTEK